jgi:superfamily II DNA or RNA helicase
MEQNISLNEIFKINIFPSIDDPFFNEKIYVKKENYVLRKQKDLRDSKEIFQDICFGNVSNEYKPFELQNHQAMVRNIFNPLTNIKRLALCWGLGPGKTIGALAIAETFKSGLELQFSRTGKQSHIFVISNEGAKFNFIKELCTISEFGYVTKKEADILRSGVPKNQAHYEQYMKLYSSVKKRIYKYYKFMPYQFFQHRTIGSTTQIRDKEITEDIIRSNIEEHINIKNSLIIVDEAHNLYNNKEMNMFGEAIMKTLDIIPSARLLLLTATPISNKVTEVIDFINLLTDNAKDRVIPEKYDLQTLKTIIYKKLPTHISYFRGANPITYPKQNIKGEFITSEFRYLKLIRCDMTKEHQRTYDSIPIEHKLQMDELHLFDIVFPRPDMNETKPLIYSSSDIRNISTASSEYFEKYQLHVRYDTQKEIELTGAFFKKEILQYYSSKFCKLLDLLNNISGKIIIYHDFTHLVGTRLIGEILNRNGFIKWSPTASSSTNLYAILDGSTTMLERTIIKNVFSANNNINGEKLRIIIGGQIIRESLDFNSVRAMIILHSPSSLAQLEQFFGRAIRHCSSKAFPENERKVDIYILASTQSKKITREVAKYLKMEKNYIINKQVFHYIKEVAIDCVANYYGNVFDSELKQFKSCEKDDNCPVECDFISCDINCSPSSDTWSKKITTLSFEMYSYPYEIKIIRQKIINLYSTHLIPIFTYDQLFSFIQKTYDVNYDLSLISSLTFILALNSIIDNETFYTKNGMLCTITYMGKWYILQPQTLPKYIGLESRIIPINKLSQEYDASISNFIEMNQYSDIISDIPTLLQMIEKTNNLVETAVIINKTNIQTQQKLLEMSIEYFVNTNMLHLTTKTSDKKIFNNILNYFKVLNLTITAQVLMQTNSKVKHQFDDYVKYDFSQIDVSFYNDISQSTTTAKDQHLDTTLEHTVIIDFNEMPDSNELSALNIIVAHIICPSSQKYCIRVYTPEKEWITETDIKIQKRSTSWEENSIIIGFLERKGDSRFIFKTREPIIKIEHDSFIKDQRLRKRGFACMSKQKKELIDILHKLDVKEKLTIENSTQELCAALEKELIRREIESSKSQNPIKWFYHFMEYIPQIV